MPTKTALIPIRGGLDIVTDKLSADPGTAKFCMNYEVGTVRGIRRIDGFSRWDGRYNFGSTDAVIVGDLGYTNGSATGWTVNTATVVYYYGPNGEELEVDGYIIAVTDTLVSPGVYSHGVTVRLTEAPSSFSTETNIYSISGGPIVDPLYFSATVVAYGSASYTYYASLVTKLPSATTTRIPGLHFFRDKLYAVVDLVAIEVTRVGTALTMLEGASLSKTSGGASIGTIAYIYPSTTTGRDIVELFDFVSGTSLSDGDDLYVSTTKVADFNAHANPQKAALYCATWDSAGGWTRVDMGRRVQYVEGASSSATAFFLPYVRRAFQEQFDANEVLNTGWIGADGAEVAGGGTAWVISAATDLQSDDGVNVTSDAIGTGNFTQFLKATWSSTVLSIPGGAVVRGVEVRIRRYASAATSVYDNVIQLAVGGIGGANKANTTTALPNAEAAATYPTTGGDTDLWGLQISPDQINSGDVALLMKFVQAATRNTIIDQVEIKVYYQEQTRKAYVYDSTQTPTDQEIEVIHYTVQSGTEVGNTGTGNRAGLLILNPEKTDTDAAKAWQWRPGLAIRTETGGGGVKLAELASDDDPVLLPSSYAIASEGSRYTFSTASPYGADDTDVFFICSGVDHAHMFDGTYALPISTGLMWQNEKPRHAAWSGNYLALGYKSGSLAISDLGDPLTYVSAVSTASEIGASDRVTGLLNLKGDSLGVFTENTVFALQGTDPTNFRRVTISPSSGAIEYTVCDMGQPMYCDFRGIATIATTDQYGDFNRGRLSWAATPWLIERLQSNQRNETIDRTVVAAVPVRNKNQYRVFFSDGWFATLTLQGLANDEVAITTSRYYGDWQDRDDSAIRVLGLCAGVTSTGQDLVFMTFDVDPTLSRFAYVFQVDSGRSFDGEEIIAQWMSQPMQLGTPFTEKHLEFLGVLGRSYGYVPFKVYQGTNFTDPVSDETTGSSTTGYDISFGVSTDAASSTEKDQKTTKNMRGSGEDVTLLFESISADKLPHTIQALSLRFRFDKEHN